MRFQKFFCIGLLLLLSSAHSPAAEVYNSEDPGDACHAPLLSAPKPNLEPIGSPLQALELIDGAVRRILSPEQIEQMHWVQLTRRSLYPALKSRTPLLISAIIGGGSAGKSNLLNSLLPTLRGTLDPGEVLSATGLRGGMTRRMVLLAPPLDRNERYRRDLADRFGPTVSWSRADDALVAGPGVLVERVGIPENLIFADTPDTDTGDPSQAGPENLNRALHVICPSDVLIGVFNASTVGQRHTLETLAHIFRSYGRKKMILVFQTDRSASPDVVNQILISLANTIYEEEGTNYPDGILGAYLMPYSSDVFQGRQAVELIPVGAFAQFRDLLLDMNTKSDEIRLYGLKGALAVAVRELSSLVRERAKMRLAAELYDRGVRVAADIAAREFLQPFPLDVAIEHVRREFHSYRSGTDRWLHRMGNFLAAPWGPFVSFAREMRSLPQQQDKLNQQMRWDHSVHDRLAISRLFLQIQDRSVLYPPARQVDSELARGLDQFYQMFPEERQADYQVVQSFQAQPPEEKRQLLPPDHLLSPSVRHFLEALVRMDLGRLTRDLSDKMDLEQFSTPAHIQTHREVDLALQRMLEQNNLKRWSLRLYDAAAVGIPGSLAIYLTNQGINNWIVWTASLIAPAYVLMALQRMSADRFVKGELDKWFANLQYRVTIEYFENQLLRNLRQVLEAEAKAGDTSLQEIQHALQYFDPTYQKLPLTLRPNSIR